MSTDPETPYNTNFCFPVKDLDTARIKLTPFIPSQHAELYFDASKSHPGLYRYLSFGPFSNTVTDFLDWQESRIRSDPAQTLFAVIDKTRPPDQPDMIGALAGIIGLLNSSPSHSRTEIGFVITLPSFQRTHVTRNAIGLLLHYCLDPPAQGGLGLRRLQWQANAENTASIRAAEKIGFTKEGVLRWERVLPPTKEGNKSFKGDLVDGPGRDTAMLSLCWDEWDSKKGQVDALIHQVIL